MKENKVAEQLTADNKNTSVLLEMQDIEKAFPGVKALDKVNLTVKAGTVHALMGENGAGKSTLMKCLFGVYTKDAGKILSRRTGDQLQKFKGSTRKRRCDGASGAQSGTEAQRHGQYVARPFSYCCKGASDHKRKKDVPMRQSRFSINSGSMSIREP